MAREGPLKDVELTDVLGRGVFDSTKAKRAAKVNGLIAHRIFLENSERDTLSVDRLDFASDDFMTEIQDRVSAPLRKFYGWAQLTVEDASRQQREVHATPNCFNRYHADIILNLLEGEERKDAQKSHANDLAAHSTWRARCDK